jgi:transcriptional regulator with XRE-family HTH domain
MNRRIKIIRKELDMNQEQFGKILGLSKSGISEIESGRRNVTEQHILMLKNYRKKRINEKWLRTGKEEIFLPEDREAELENLTDDLLMEEPDSFKNKFISLVAKMNDEEWAMLENLVNQLASRE